MHGKEQGLPHKAGIAPANVPPPCKRYQSFRSQQTSQLFHGVLLVALLICDGVVQLQALPTTSTLATRDRYPRSNASSIKPNRYLGYGFVINPPDNTATTDRPVSKPGHNARSNSSTGFTQTKHIPFNMAGTLNASTTRPGASPEHSGSGEGTGKSTATPLMNGTDGVGIGTDLQDIANETLSKMDTRVNRCDDFYGYVCGGFTAIPKQGMHYVNTYSVFNDKHEGRLYKIVARKLSNESLPYRPYQVARQLYERCMDTNKIKRESKKTLLDVLDSLEGWPIQKGVGRWNISLTWSWEESLKAIRELGYKSDYLFDISIRELKMYANFKLSIRRVLYVDQPSLGISRKDLLDGELNGNVDSYTRSIYTVAKWLGAEHHYAVKHAKRIVEFEMNLANITVPKAPANYNITSVKKLQEKYPGIDWLGYINAMFTNTSIDIDENEIIIVVGAPSYMENLLLLLHKTPKRTIANYLLWRVIQFSSSFLSNQLRNTVLGTQQEQENRTKECVDITVQRLYLVVSTLHFTNHIRDESRRDVLVMANEIRKEFVDILSKIEWMDKSTRQTAMDRMNSTVFHLGYDDEPVNENKLVEYYEGLEFNPQASYLRTVLNIDKFTMTKTFKELRKPVKVLVSYHDSSGIKYYHNVDENVIRFAPHFLSSPYYSPTWPSYKKYGAFGPIIGRMMIRCLGNQGWQIDKTGIPADWCQTDTGKAFMNRVGCILKQYTNRRSIGYQRVHLQVEDHGGILLAYNAYKKWAASNESEMLRPDLTLTFDQMFWVSAAQYWCSVYPPKEFKGCPIIVSPHPDQFRVLATMGNMDEFSRDFGCPYESRMNPAEKCKLW